MLFLLCLIYNKKNGKRCNNVISLSGYRFDFVHRHVLRLGTVTNRRRKQKYFTRSCDLNLYDYVWSRFAQKNKSNPYVKIKKNHRAAPVREKVPTLSVDACELNTNSASWNLSDVDPKFVIIYTDTLSILLTT